MLLSEIATKLQAQLIGDGQQDITGVNTIADAGGSELCFLTSAKYVKTLSQSTAAGVLVDKPVDDCDMDQLVVASVDAALISLLKLFEPILTAAEGVHPTAVVEPTASVDSSATVGPGAYIAHGVCVGPDTIIGPNCSIGENTTIGSSCRLDSHVVVYHNCQIGNFCVIQANSTIGATGFGYSFVDGAHRLIPHNGGVILEDGVEIGSNSCIDRAKFGNTLIGAGTKVDNLVQIAHNVQTGKCCLMAGHVGISGSTKVGNGVVFAGASGSSDHVEIGDGAVLGAQAVATGKIEPGQTVLGLPARDVRRELKSKSVYRNLPELAKEVKQLGKRIEKLEATKNNKN
ncbi:MAG: UDP-3-O-(3-hydroxymyristoyl)glucosamine N-acyltransferase [Planctomycetota bacterium]|nr:MAG: UDP-3-O-(3-hydroxymyristoyl)glucosamine N-acyltransferase [Planctomycetota bacterium]